MQRTILSALLVAGFVGSAFAETPNAVPEAPFVSGKTRAQVQAELVEYQRAGVNPYFIAYNPLSSFQGTKTRKEVTAEYMGSREEVHALTGEDSGAEWMRTASHQAPAADLVAAH